MTHTDPQPQLPGFDIGRDEPTSFSQSLLKALDSRKTRQNFITHNQVTGWKFSLRRITSGLTMRDTQMFIDPVREQSKPFKIGTILAVTIAIGCLMFSFLKPTGSIGNHLIFSDRKTKALYVKMGEKIYPVFNLTSAQLITGKNEAPKEVNSAVIDSLPLGNLIGIPSAPGRILQSFQPADWSVCHKELPNLLTETIVIGHTHLTPLSQIVEKIDRHQRYIQSLPSNQGIIVRNHKFLWLLWNNHRSLIHQSQPVIRHVFNLLATPQITMRDQLLNLIPRANDLMIPKIDHYGIVPAYMKNRSLPAHLAVGSVIHVQGIDDVRRYYVVLDNGIEQIGPVLAQILTYIRPTLLHLTTDFTLDHINRVPQSHSLDISAYPPQELLYISPREMPVVCLRWQKDHDAIPAVQTILVGSMLPMPSDWKLHVPVDGGQGNIANATVLPPGHGYLAQLTGSEANSIREESLMWISETGVCYPIPGLLEQNNPTLRALNLYSPTTYIPQGIAILLLPGPVLSHSTALANYDVSVTPIDNSNILRTYRSHL